MSSTYTKSLAGDFGGSWNQSQFHQEIVAEAGITPTLLRIDAADDVIDITFDSALSAGEQTTLSTLISNHTPFTDLTTNLYGESATESLTTSTDYVQKYRLTMNNVSAGDYYVQWSFDLSNSVTSAPSIVRVQIDDTTTLTEHGHTLENDTSIAWKNVSGFKRVTLTSGSHNIDVDYKSTGKGGSCKIKSVHIWVQPANM